LLEPDGGVVRDAKVGTVRGERSASSSGGAWRFEGKGIDAGGVEDGGRGGDAAEEVMMGGSAV